MVRSAAQLGTLATTAWWSAAARALESKRRDRLFDDPWAELLLGRQSEALLSDQTVAPDVLAAYELYAVVTRFFDDFLLHTATDCAVRQVVLVASGLDTRAFRLAWPPGTHVFELEQPHVLTYQDMWLAHAGVSPTCVRHAVGADLNRCWDRTLCAAGFDALRPSVWLLEGFLYFVAEPAVLRLLARITALAAHDSWMGLDIVNRAILVSPATRHWSERMAAAEMPWLFSCDEPEAFLQRFGWRARAVEPGMGQADFGRAPYGLPARGDRDAPRSFLVTALRCGLAEARRY
jgi:methyltransferase (TIGR00027 family)